MQSSELPTQHSLEVDIGWGNVSSSEDECVYSYCLIIDAGNWLEHA